ncbi:WxL protein peptidoglycan domain-containing protein [Arthrobacter liuii]|uniref:DUF916 domain-containing protein n=1 Tax=Arthrobacter liuii TaxID=1476996 RepID=A0ABQ2AZ16_9MICC|nr:DUF916 domain-containing protein [Arthrobacter liuii]GGI02821.1 hypothetical protein GCM10007170_45430 [Arthrobacter liuii]
MTPPSFFSRGRGPVRMVLCLVLLVLAVFSTTGQAFAVDDGTVGIRPAHESDFFHISLYPGSAIDAEAVVANHSQAPVTLLNYPVDGQTTPQGGFALAAQTDPQKGIGAWVSLKTDHLTIPANSEVKVPFRLTVPAGTPPGDYAGALIIQSPPVQGKTSTVNGDTSVRIDVVQRQGVRIYLNVAGTAVKSLTHGDLSWQQNGSDLALTLPVRNTGNTILHPTAELALTGWPISDTSVKFDTPESLLPGSSIDLHATVAQVPAAMNADAQARLESEAGSDQASTHILYAPWLILGIALLVLAGISYGVWRGLRLVRSARAVLAQTQTAPEAVAGRHRQDA